MAATTASVPINLLQAQAQTALAARLRSRGILTAQLANINSLIASLEQTGITSARAQAVLQGASFCAETQDDKARSAQRPVGARTRAWTVLVGPAPSRDVVAATSAADAQVTALQAATASVTGGATAATPAVSAAIASADVYISARDVDIDFFETTSTDLNRALDATRDVVKTLLEVRREVQAMPQIVADIINVAPVPTVAIQAAIAPATRAEATATSGLLVLATTPGLAWFVLETRSTGVFDPLTRNAGDAKKAHAAQRTRVAGALKTLQVALGGVASALPQAVVTGAAAQPALIPLIAQAPPSTAKALPFPSTADAATAPAPAGEPTGSLSPQNVDEVIGIKKEITALREELALHGDSGMGILRMAFGSGRSTADIRGRLDICQRRLRKITGAAAEK